MDQGVQMGFRVGTPIGMLFSCVLVLCQGVLLLKQAIPSWQMHKSQPDRLTAGTEHMGFLLCSLTSGFCFWPMLSNVIGMMIRITGTVS